MARVYDIETRNVYQIPDAELAPGMLQARIQGIEGTVWVDASQLRRGEPKFFQFGEDLRDNIRAIKATFDEVSPQSLEEWEDGFRRDADPKREIDLWLHMADVFDRATEEKSLTLEQKRDYFRVIVACSNAPRDQVLFVADRKVISRSEAEQVVTLFFDGHQHDG